LCRALPDLRGPTSSQRRGGQACGPRSSRRSAEAGSAAVLKDVEMARPVPKQQELRQDLAKLYVRLERWEEAGGRGGEGTTGSLADGLKGRTDFNHNDEQC